MKKNILFSGLLASAILALTANADFSKINTYTEGMFSDVTPDKWYESSVASAYELGFMKGSSDSAFEPEGNMTVAEAITIASRMTEAIRLIVILYISLNIINSKWDRDKGRE